MTKKYEKFEEWMIGKKISVGDCEGVVLGRHFPSIVPSGVVCIQYKIGDQPTDWRWVELADVAFLEEVAHEEETSPIPWQVGQTVWDVRYGKGIVDTLLAIPCQYPIGVVFTDGSTASYTSKGLNRCTDVYRSLFFSEPVVTAQLYPPKKPFKPTLKKGDKVVLTDSVADYVAEVVRGEENHIYYKTEDGVVTFVNKNSVNVFKLGEEIKWEN